MLNNARNSIASITAALLASASVYAATPEPIPADQQQEFVAPFNENGPPPQFVNTSTPPKPPAPAPAAAPTPSPTAAPMVAPKPVQKVATPVSAPVPATEPVLTTAPKTVQKVATPAPISEPPTAPVVEDKKPVVEEKKKVSPPSEKAARASTAAHPEVARGIFTTRVVNKEPSDNLTEVPEDTQRIYFFTQLNDLKGETIRHRWDRNGIPQGESTFEVGNWHWRVWSLKTIGGRAGKWTVKVLNGAGDVLGEYSIQVGSPPPPQ